MTKRLNFAVVMIASLILAPTSAVPSIMEKKTGCAVDHGEKDEVISLHVGLKLSY